MDGDATTTEWDEDARQRLAEVMDVRPPQAIAVLNHFGIADLLIDGPRHVADLATHCGAHELTLYRLLRFAAMYGVFTEIEPKTFALTPMASFLRSDAPESVYWKVADDRDSSGVALEPWYRWTEWLATARTGEPAYDRVYGRSYWDGLRTDDTWRAMFHEMLRTLGSRQIPAVLPHLDLSARRTLVDVGAGEGSWTVAFLNRWPELQAVCVDLEENATVLQAAIDEAGLQSRAEARVGDFFVDVPTGDVILLANVLHDWDDAWATTILQRCASALVTGGEVLIVDRVLPEGDTAHLGKSVDINMLFNLGGRERTLREFAEIAAPAGVTITEHIETGLPIGVLRASHV